MSTLSVNTITAETGNTVSLASGKTLNASQGFTAPAGHVIQFVKSPSILTAGITTTSNNPTEISTGLRVTITPKSTSSTIVWMMMANFVTAATSHAGLDVRRSINGGSYSDITTGNGNEAFRQRGGETDQRQGTIIYYNQPNTTQSVVYTPYFWTNSGSNGFIINDNGMGTFCIAMEISG